MGRLGEGQSPPKGKVKRGNRFVHGMTGTSEHNAWRHAIERCYNPNDPRYNSYGARGIRVCDEWKSFPNFYRDMGGRPTGSVLDRIDVNESYCKENCRWVTQKQSARNKSRTLWATINGITKSVAEWCEELKLVHRKVAWQRVFRDKWEPSRAVLTPSKTIKL